MMRKLVKIIAMSVAALLSMFIASFVQASDSLVNTSYFVELQFVSILTSQDVSCVFQVDDDIEGAHFNSPLI